MENVITYLIKISKPTMIRLLLKILMMQVTEAYKVANVLLKKNKDKISILLSRMFEL